MDESDLKKLRELVEFLKASGVAEFDMEQPEMKVRLKFAGPEAGTATPAGAGIDLAALAQLMRPAAAVAAPLPVATGVEGSVAPANGGPVAEAAAAPAEVDEEAGLHIVKSPLVGTFYDAPSPGADLFVKVGEMVESGKVLCIVEAMKIMNEIESDASGQVIKVFVKPGQPVEYGQKLFGLRA